MKNMKRSLTAIVVVGLIFGNVFVVSAQTATTTPAMALQALIQNLQKQIESLNAQLQVLRQAQQQVVTTTGDVQDTLKLIKQLREGSSGDDVKLLQAILAADVSVYPEGRITGYYGKLTAQAVKRFQKLYKLDQVGNVGPKTLEKIREQLEKNPVTVETRNGVKTICAIVPPGHLIAPGWLRKMEGVAPIVSVCQTLPPGIAAKLGLATTTPDTTAPKISDVEIKNIAANSVKIEWETNEPATSVIWYGTATSVSIGNGLTISSTTLVRDHELVLSGLSASTTYYYIVASADVKGNTATSSQRSFTTLLIPDTTTPIISNVLTASTTANGSHVQWTTNEPATSVAWYGTSTPVTTANGGSSSSSALVSGHDLTLSGLSANTTYYYMVVSADGAGNTATSSQYSFITAAILDTTAPAISGIAATSTTSSASRIVWTTNEQATGKLWYSTSTPVVTTVAPSASNETPLFDHDFLLSGLTSSTTYYYVVSSGDAAGNTSTSTEAMFQTLAQSAY